MKTHKGTLTRDEFVKQFDTKINMSKTDRKPRRFKTFQGVNVYYVYMPDDILTTLSQGKIFNNNKKQKYKLIIAIRKSDGEFYGGGVL